MEPEEDLPPLTPRLQKKLDQIRKLQQQGEAYDDIQASVNRITPRDIDTNMRGWISPKGEIYVGDGELHEELVGSIKKKYGERVGKAG